VSNMGTNGNLIKIYNELPPIPTHEELEKAEMAARIAKYDEERRGFELRNEAQEIELTAHKIKSTQNFVYTFYGPIMPPSAYECISTLGQWTRKSEPGTELTIMLNSPGGSVKDGFGLLDYIKFISQTHPIKIKVFGGAESMAAVVLQAATTRAIQPNAFLMVHESQMEGDEGFSFTSSEWGDVSKRLTQVNDRLYSILAERSTMAKAKIKQRCNRKNAWIDSDEALDLGLVDVVEY
jgi:ATP-dependent Clp protease, protease subunit